MKITLKTELSFIKKKGILEGNVESKGFGSFVFYTTDGFKQILKQNEYDKLLVAADITSKTSDPAPETKTAGSPPSKTIKEREVELQALSKAELVELAEVHYEDIKNTMQKNKLIDLIIEAEFEDEEE